MKHITVVAAVIEKEGKILCVQRGKSQHAYISEKWEFPGGKIEKGESEIETIQREILEELNMRIVVIDKLMVVEHDYPDFHITMHTYCCNTKDEPTLTEHQAFRWLEKHELPTLDWAAADKPIVGRVIIGIRNIYFPQ